MGGERALPQHGAERTDRFDVALAAHVNVVARCPGPATSSNHLWRCCVTVSLADRDDGGVPSSACELDRRAAAPPATEVGPDPRRIVRVPGRVVQLLVLAHGRWALRVDANGDRGPVDQGKKAGPACEPTALKRYQIGGSPIQSHAGQPVFNSKGDPSRGRQSYRAFLLPAASATGKWRISLTRVVLYRAGTPTVATLLFL